MTVAKGPGGPISLDIAPRKVELDLALTNVTMPDKQQTWGRFKTQTTGSWRSFQWARFDTSAKHQRWQQFGSLSWATIRSLKWGRF